MSERTAEATGGRLAEILRQAMQVENDGHQFFRMAAHSAGDPQATRVFLAMAEEEREHLRYLRRHYVAVLETGALASGLALAVPAEEPGAIFSPALKERAGQAHFELSALSIGVQLELRAVKFYQAQAAAAEDEAERVLFAELAEWESGHYRALLAQQEALKESFWAAGGFSPL